MEMHLASMENVTCWAFRKLYSGASDSYTGMFSLTNLVRRAGVSITSNIAEGFSRNTSKEKYQFYSIAHGSLSELQNQLFIAKDVGYLDNESFNKVFDQTNIVSRLLNGLKRIKYQ